MLQVRFPLPTASALPLRTGAMYPYRVYPNQMSWSSAGTACQAVAHLSADLASLNSEGELNYAMDQPCFGFNFACKKYWVGFNDIASEGTFVWSDGSTNVLSASQLWRSGEPNNSGGNENCAHMDEVFLDKRMADADCSTPMRYICEADREFSELRAEVA